MGWFSGGTSGSENAVSNNTQQDSRAARRSQAVNQHQAGAQAGRAQRSIGGRTTARTEPSRRWNG